MTLIWEYPSVNRKRLSLRVRSQSCGTEIGALEMELSYLPSLDLYTRDSRGRVPTTSTSVRLGIVVYNGVVERKCGIGQHDRYYVRWFAVYAKVVIILRVVGAG